ncbi:carbohydrate-binding protein [Paenibacillus larvae]|nr:carbohydrate-binding protein [Paenibacillus larvae]MDT2302955.1 carbohydrate-binding protein [Paenibacillus larvae]
MTVLYKGLEYKAKYWTKGDQPDKSDAWRLMKPVILEWDKDKVYYGGDQVIYQGLYTKQNGGQEEKFPEIQMFGKK